MLFLILSSLQLKSSSFFFKFGTPIARVKLYLQSEAY